MDAAAGPRLTLINCMHTHLAQHAYKQCKAVCPALVRARLPKPLVSMRVTLQEVAMSRDNQAHGKNVIVVCTWWRAVETTTPMLISGFNSVGGDIESLGCHMCMVPL